MSVYTREALIGQIARTLGQRKLYWFGTRGDDAASLIDLEPFQGCFSYINTWSGWPLEFTGSLEDITHRRVDLDAYDIDDHINDPEVQELRQAMLYAMSHESAIVTYRPSEFLSILGFQRSHSCQYLGLFFQTQHAFEFKPWVENMVAHAKPEIGWLGWEYVAKEDRDIAAQRLTRQPVVLRGSRGSGGVGMRKASTPGEFLQGWPDDDTAFVNVAAYRQDCLPLNIGAVVWPDGGVTLHWPSVQLIGLLGLTTTPFGYCGNDFAATASLPPEYLDLLEKTTRQLGGLIYAQGYRGAFGVDYLLDPRTGELLFTEINPRSQGSTRLSCAISRELGQPCILLEHIAAMLAVQNQDSAISCPEQAPLQEWVHDAPPTAQIIVHNTSATAAKIDPGPVLQKLTIKKQIDEASIIVNGQTICDSDAVICNLRLARNVTPDGYSLHSNVDRTLLDAGIYNLNSITESPNTQQDNLLSIHQIEG